MTSRPTLSPVADSDVSGANNFAQSATGSAGAGDAGAVAGAVGDSVAVAVSVGDSVAVAVSVGDSVAGAVADSLSSPAERDGPLLGLEQPTATNTTAMATPHTATHRLPLIASHNPSARAHPEQL